jgi:hypothetical protein
MGKYWRPRNWNQIVTNTLDSIEDKPTPKELINIGVDTILEVLIDRSIRMYGKDYISHKEIGTWIFIPKKVNK